MKIKNFIAFLMIGMAMCGMCGSCSDDDDDPDNMVISVNDLPKAAQIFLDDYFGSETIVRVDKEVDYSALGAEYEVKFKSGGEVEFDPLGNWVSIEAPVGGAVPDALVPVPIKNYVSANYPSDRICEIKKEKGQMWEVELSSDIDLYFDGDFNFVRADR